MSDEATPTMETLLAKIDNVHAGISSLQDQVRTLTAERDAAQDKARELHEAIVALRDVGVANDSIIRWEAARDRVYQLAESPPDGASARAEAPPRPPHRHEWGSVKAGPPDGDPGRYCDGCGEFRLECAE